MLFIQWVLSDSGITLKQQIHSQLSLDTRLLVQSFNQHIDELITELNAIDISTKNPSLIQRQVENILKRRKSIYHLNYLSPDAQTLYSSTKTKLEWQSNLLNRSWYRELIKKWKPVISPVYKSHISPFPSIIALAIPKTIDQKIHGFWLVYLDIKLIDTIFPTLESEKYGKFTVWFDGNGTIIKSNSTAEKNINKISIQKNKWWFTINEIKENKDDLSDELVATQENNTEKYLYATHRSSYGNFLVLVVQNESKATSLFRSLKKNIILLAIIIQIIILLITAAILYQWEKQKSQLQLVQHQSSELKNVNHLLENKTSDLIQTNQKLDKLTSELSNQKEDLLKLNNNLERLQKYLNFLTVPVFAVDEYLEVEFANRAAERTLEYSMEYMLGKAIHRILKFSDSHDFIACMKKAKFELQRCEISSSIEIKNEIRHYLLSCDYLKLSDWSGYVVTFTDLTDLLSLQEEIKDRNKFLTNSSYLIHSFLNISDQANVLNDSIKTICDYADAKTCYYYQLEEQALKLYAQFPKNKSRKFPQIPIHGSIAGSTLTNGRYVIINNKNELPNNLDTVEKQLEFQSAIFSPIIINKEAIGVIILIDPATEIINNYNSTIKQLLESFEIGLTTLIYYDALKHKNVQLENNANYRAQLIRSTTHGLRNPLSTIKGYVRLMQLKFNSYVRKNPDLWKYITKIELATDEMADQLLMYLDLARINRNDLHFQIKETSTINFLDPVINLLQKEAKQRSVQLKISGINKLPKKIKIDSDRFIFALRTICLNALRFSPAHDTVKLDFSNSNDKITISLEDHGPEIKKIHIPLIGSESLPQDLAGERIHYGNNLEMALATKLIQLIEGELIVTSTVKKTLHKIILPIKNTIHSKNVS